jgi:exosortase
MKRNIHVALFAWAAYILVFLQVLWGALRDHPKAYSGDDLLLFGAVPVVLWIERQSIRSSIMASVTGYGAYGAIVFACGLFLCVIGQVVSYLYFEVWGLFLMASGLLMALSAREHVGSALFIGLFGTVMVLLGRVAPEMLSAELAVNIASLTALLLNGAVLPITSSGVTLYFGPYVAEVTKACAGMNSIFSLIALSLLYVRQGMRRTLWHDLALMACVIPVAVAANLLRVISLVLATWYVGEGFAQGVVHDLAGVLSFVLALLMLYGVDRALFRFFGSRSFGEG